MSKRLLTVLGGTKKQAQSVVFNGSNTRITAGTEASIDDLPLGDFTVELWIKTTKLTGQFLVGKAVNNVSGWFCYPDNRPQVTGYYDDGNLDVYGTVASLSDGEWHHYAVTHTLSEKKYRLFLDGILQVASNAASGNYVSDAASNLTFGSAIGGALLGSMGWIRISNSLRYTGNYIIPSRFIYPIVDANTVRLFKLNEGTGTTIVDHSTNAQNATLTNGIWELN